MAPTLTCWDELLHPARMADIVKLKFDLILHTYTWLASKPRLIIDPQAGHLHFSTA